MTSTSDVATKPPVTEQATVMVDRLLNNFKSSINGLLKARKSPTQAKKAVLDHLKRELKIAFPQEFSEDGAGRLTEVIAQAETKVSEKVDAVVAEREPK